MSNVEEFQVIGVRADGTIGFMIEFDSMSRAKVAASLIAWQHDDWKVRIETPEPETGRPRRFSSHVFN